MTSTHTFGSSNTKCNFCELLDAWQYTEIESTEHASQLEDVATPGLLRQESGGMVDGGGGGVGGWWGEGGEEGRVQA